MNDIPRHVLLLSKESADEIALCQLFEGHPDKITITSHKEKPSDWSPYGLVIGRHHIETCPIPSYILPDAPLRAGHVLDYVESILLQILDQIDIQYKQYQLLWQSNILQINDQSFDLTETEKNIVYALIKGGENGLHRDEMLKNIWDYRADLDTHTLETHIYRLRQKIEPDQTKPMYLCTIPNGYKLI